MAVEFNMNLDDVRRKMRDRKGGRQRDPHEWKPDKVEEGKTMKWKFFILPPVDSMSLWYYPHGYHFIEGRGHECPRLHDEMDCPMCDYAFGLMQHTDDRDKRSKIARAFLPSPHYAVNIYFPKVRSVSEDLRGKVYWYSMSQSVFNICEEVINTPAPEEGAEPQAHGLFFDPNNAYALTLTARHKNGFNNYDATLFDDTPAPITSKGDDQILKILEMRHDIPTKFPDRNIETLQSIVDKLSQKSPKASIDMGGSPSESSGKSNAGKSNTEKSSAEKAETKQEPESESELEDDLEDEPEEKQEPKSDKSSISPVEDDLDDSGDNESSGDAEIDDDDPELESLLNELNS